MIWFQEQINSVEVDTTAEERKQAEGLEKEEAEEMPE
jgi:hypothetical protein